MEPISLTVGAVAAALVAKAQERAVDATADAGAGVLRALIERVRRRFVDACDGEGTRVLELVEQAPDSPRLTGRLAAAIDHHVTAEPAFAAELEQLIAQAKAGGVDIESISLVAWGDHNVQIAGVTGSQISISRRQPPGRPAA